MHENSYPKIHFISGLGADERVFQFLHLPGYKNVYIQWEKPLKNEPLNQYVLRLIPQIDLQNDVILVGVSFGGIVCQELAKKIPCKKIIILSSIKDSSELDWQLKIVRFLRLYRMVPKRFLKWSNLLTGNYYFSTQTEDESKLLRAIITDTDSDFMKWAIKEIMLWKSTSKDLKNLFHIHGTRDRIFPAGTIKNYIPVNGGGHFMIVNRSEEVSGIIRNIIEK